MSSTDGFIATHPVTTLVENTTVAEFKIMLANPVTLINGTCDAIRCIQEYKGNFNAF
jgi:hypothetical protein